MNDTFIYTAAQIAAIQKTAFDKGMELGLKRGEQNGRFWARREEIKRILEETRVKINDGKTNFSA